MSSQAPERALEETTRELIDVLRDIEAAVEPPNPGRLIQPPTPRGLLEFTSEVGIPAAILVLRTNIAALELLQRSLRMMGEYDDRTDSVTGIRSRATDLTVTSLARLDDALADLQTAIDGRSIDRSPEDLLSEARERTEELEAQLSGGQTERMDDELGRRGARNVDVEAELDSLRETVDSANGGGKSPDGTDDE